MEEVAFIASSFCFLDSAGNFPSNISRCNASEEVQVACVGVFQAASDQAAGVVQCWVKCLCNGLTSPKQDMHILQRNSTGPEQ